MPMRKQVAIVLGVIAVLATGTGVIIKLYQDALRVQTVENMANTARGWGMPGSVREIQGDRRGECIDTVDVITGRLCRDGYAGRDILVEADPKHARTGRVRIGGMSVHMLPAFRENPASSPFGTFEEASRMVRLELPVRQDLTRMSAEEFTLFCMKLLVILLPRTNQEGVILYRTDHLNALIRLGTHPRDGLIAAQIWSSDDKIKQTIYFGFGADDRDPDAVIDFLAHYRIGEALEVESAKPWN